MRRYFFVDFDLFVDFAVVDSFDAFFADLVLAFSLLCLDDLFADASFFAPCFLALLLVAFFALRVLPVFSTVDD